MQRGSNQRQESGWVRGQQGWFGEPWASKKPHRRLAASPVGHPWNCPNSWLPGHNVSLGVILQSKMEYGSHCGTTCLHPSREHWDRNPCHPWTAMLGTVSCMWKAQNPRSQSFWSAKHPNHNMKMCSHGTHPRNRH